MLELKSDHPNITNSHNSIAVIYEQKSDYTHALESYEKELGIHI
jgi:Tfp pilus assembly protein PilF